MLFPDDIFLEILSKLPVKNLMRFKCVSKSWYSLIRDPHLAKLHRFHHLSNRVDSSFNIALFVRKRGYSGELQSHKLAVVRDNITRFEKILSITDKIKYDSQILSCEGLLCFARKGKLHVCNPTTRELECLPGTIESSDDGDFGFGYDPTRNEYKVVKSLIQPERTCKFEVFTLGSDGPWRSIAQTAGGAYQRPVALNGFIYWISYHPTKIVAFDVRDEKLEEIKVPHDFEEELLDYAMLVALDNNLCLVTNERCVAGTGSELDIWMLKNRTSGLWVKEYSIEPERCGMHFKAFALCMWRGKIVLQRHGYRLFFYDPKTRTSEEVQGNWGRGDLDGDDWDRVERSEITDYVESLVSVKRSDNTCLTEGGGFLRCNKRKRERF